MLNESLRTAPVTFLEVPGVVRRLRAAAERLCAADANVLGVVLFGSLARGTATPASDADLLVLLRVDARRIPDRIPDYTRPFESPGLAAQVWPWTEAEWTSRLKAGDRFAAEIAAQGVILAGHLPAGATTP